MWTDSKVTSIMGLNVTATKRKYEDKCTNERNDCFLNCPPIKTIKWSADSTSITHSSHHSGEGIGKLEVVSSIPCEPWITEPVADSISKLQAVTVPSDTWGSIATKATLATTVSAGGSDDVDEDDFDDDYEKVESIIPTYCPQKYSCSPSRKYVPYGYCKPNLYSDGFRQQDCSRTANQLMRIANLGWNNQNGNCFFPSETTHSQQTIRCAENGKSYLELGTTSFNNNIKHCCESRNIWCNSKNCHKEIRLKIRSLSMIKLSRFRHVSEQSLYRSVLICNTLKQIDKEMETECKNSSLGRCIEFSTSQTNRISSDTINSTFHQQNQFFNNLNTINNGHVIQSVNQMNSPRISSTFNSLCVNDALHAYDHHSFRETQFGRTTPFPDVQGDTDSGYSEDESNRSINWSSVLNLSSGSALDPMNNNDLLPTGSVTSLPATTPLSVSGTFTTSAAITTSSNAQIPSVTNSTWEYGFFDMDLGLGPELTELLPSCKISSDDLLKSVSSSIGPTRYVHETELETPAHIMVGS